MTAQPLSAGRSIRGGILERALAVRVPLRWEFFAYAAVAVAAIGFRFWDLGSRALHHDESIHAQWSWDLLRGNYTHSPVFHGPFYYHLQGSMFFLFGANDYTSRLSAAVFGSIIVFLPLLLRRWLGPVGTFAAVAFLAFSPTLVYYSRFLREDIYMAAFVLLMVAAMWRYIESGRERWLIIFALAFTGAITTKEGTFLTVGVFLVMLDIYVAAELATQTLRNRGMLSPLRRAVLTASFSLLAVPVVAFWPFLGRLRRSYDWDRFPRSADILVLLGTIVLPLLTPILREPLEKTGFVAMDIPIANGEFTSRLNWEKHLHANISLNDGLALGGLFAITTSAAAFVGLQWKPRIWLISFLGGALIYLTLMTSFWTNWDGLVSGPWGSLDYWITQQGEYRGDQPWFYYYLLMPAYEFLPLIIAVGGIWWSVVRGNAFSRFLAGWIFGQWMMLSIGSEKMPWLNTHLAIPTALLAAWTINRAWQGRRSGLSVHSDALRLGAVAVAACVAGLLIVELPTSAGLNALRVALAVAVAAVAIIALRPAGRRMAGVALCAIAVGGLGVFSVQAMVQASFTRGDIPKDLLIYTQSSPDIARLMAEIEQLGEVTGKGKYLPIAVDGQDSFAWPWAWYLRDYKCISYGDLSTGSVPLSSCQGQEQPYAVMLVNRSNADKINETLAESNNSYYGSPRKYPHRWWFSETYKSAMSVVPNSDCTGQYGDCGLWTGHLLYIPNFIPNTKSWERIYHGFVDDGWLTTWYRYWRDHDPDSLAKSTGPSACNSCGSVDAFAYFPAAFDPKTGKLALETAAPTNQAAAPTRDESGRLQFGGSGFRPGQFGAPVDIETDAAGNLYVIDSLRKKLQKFDPQGNFLGLVDIRINPQNANEAAQPWGLAIAPSGAIVVADTFGWRIRLFDADLKSTGGFGQVPKTDPGTTPGPFELFGPRDAAFDASGRIWVTDTGHDRLLIYRANGDFIRAVGTAGNGRDQFNEPVGIAIMGDSVFVADMFNSRVVVLNGEGAWQSEFKVEGWGGQRVDDKPYIRALADGRLAVSMPALNQVRIYTRTGTLSATITGGDQPLNKPYGVLEAADGKLWIVEGGASRVRQFDLPR